MEMNKMNELKDLLLSVEDSYNDFVLAILDEAKKSDYRRDELLKYLRSNKRALSSDVVKFVMVDLGLYNEYRDRECKGILAS